MKGHHYMSDTNKFIVLPNKLIINKRTHSSHNNCINVFVFSNVWSDSCV